MSAKKAKELETIPDKEPDKEPEKAPEKETKKQDKKPAKEKLSAENLFIDSCKSWVKCEKPMKEAAPPNGDEDDLSETISDSFSAVWLSMEVGRRENSTGMFVQAIGREPTETEILTGEIQNET
jgi:hypothetical protein